MQEAAEIMTSPVVSIDADATVADALERMRSAGITSLLVHPAEPDGPVGFFSQADAVARIVAASRDPADVRLHEVASRPVITVPPDTSVEDCALLMSKSRIHRLLVHDGAAVVGIVSASDILGMGRA